MELIIPDAQAFGETSPLFPVHVHAGLIQIQGMIPQGKGITKIDEIDAPVRFFLFHFFSVRHGLSPLAQIYVELFQLVFHAHPGNDFFFFTGL